MTDCTCNTGILQMLGNIFTDVTFVNIDCPVHGAKSTEQPVNGDSERSTENCDTIDVLTTNREFGGK